MQRDDAYHSFTYSLTHSSNIESLRQGREDRNSLPSWDEHEKVLIYKKI